jgi:hypothetical protein
VARERASELRETGARKAAAYRASRAGQLADVIVVGNGEQRRGLTEDYLEIDLPPGAGARGDRIEIVIGA